nr:MAG TPA: hypothetical protein [Caudoviricetes sp.]
MLLRIDSSYTLFFICLLIYTLFYPQQTNEPYLYSPSIPIFLEINTFLMKR